MGHYDFRFRQKVTFEGPSPVEVFDPGFSFGGDNRMRRTMYRPEPEREMRDVEFRRKLLEYAANKIVEFATAARNGVFYPNPTDIDLGPLGVLKNVHSIVSVDFRKDLVIEYEGWLNGEFEG